ncbi:unnamed protein product [Somion occarium]|uniref:Uncharacterized protein n=1 Tax=Somion occarium TaxID=3059160 RepID=A0ABP1DXR0_9APHY
MSAYFIPRSRGTSTQQSPSHTSEAQVSSSRPEESVLTLDLERSIYLFPNPSSIPPSPSGSSAYSVPSDFSFSSPGGSRERTISRSTDASGDAYIINHGRPRLHSSSSYASASWQNSPLVRSSADLDTEVELWDWTEELREEVVVDESELEAAVERASRWDIPSRHFRDHPLRTITGPSPPRIVQLGSCNVRLDGTHQRTRTQSNISFASLSSFSSSPFGGPPHPRIRIPLLSFIASLFGLDLDDPALRLLTTSSSDSVLFPGQGCLVGLQDSEKPQMSKCIRIDVVDDDTTEEKPHGLLKLFILSDDSRTTLQSLKSGLGAVASPIYSIPETISVPTFSSFFGLSRLVGDLWSKGGEAVQQLRAPS